jgi:hypothetical protein
MSCPQCRLVKHVTVFPYHCRCGTVHHGRTCPKQLRPRVDPLACIHRGAVIGELDCGCAGAPAVHQCEKHGECSRRKLKPGTPTIRYQDGTSATKSIGYCNACGDLQPIDLAEVALITVHFNPHRRQRLRDTYYEWRPTLHYPVQCMELVFAPHDSEIADSTEIRGNSRNMVWQKERLINLAFESLPGHVRYVGWLDHDLVFTNPDWLHEAIVLLKSGVAAVQPFDQIEYLDRDGKVIDKSKGAASTYLSGREPSSGPGGAWIARRDFLTAVGGIYDRNIVGGGDAIWFSAITNTRTQFLGRQPATVQAHAKAWMAKVGTPEIACVDGSLRHLWHGDRSLRQYVSRDAILRAHDFDPEQHIEIDDAGLLAWTDAAPAALRTEVSQYFADRRDDG